MTNSPSDDREDRETGLDKVMGVVALLFWSVLLIEALGITLMVGLTDIEPRAAALMMLVPALAVWAVTSLWRSWRRAAATLFPPYFG